jgi:hypothetical protein
VKVSVQWSTDPPSDWVELDLTLTGAGSRRWRNLPQRPVPKGGERIDAQPGWIFAAAIDGVTFQGFDHLAVIPRPGHLEVLAWVDDVEDFDDPQSLSYRWGEQWAIHKHRPDPRFGGRENTHQVKTVYAEDLEDMGRFFPQETTGGPVQLRPWSEFPMPPAEVVRHGVWVDDELFARHHAVRSQRDWKTWVA